MKVLVIGGNRFFGKRLVHLLYEAGHSVTVANRGSKLNLFRESVKQIVVDRTDESAMSTAFGGTSWDIVYDQVCSSGSEAEVMKKIFADRIGKLIFTSTASVYDPAPNRPESFFDPINFDKDDPSEHDYQHGKRLAEKSYLSADFSVVSVRIPVVVGQDDYKMRMHWHIERVVKQEPIYFPNIDARYSFIRSEDAAKFLLWLLSNKTVTGAVNACSPDPVCLADFMRCIEENLRLKAVYANKPTADNHSPYGIVSDSFLSVSKAVAHGFTFPHATDWFPQLVADLCRKYTSWVGTQI